MCHRTQTLILSVRGGGDELVSYVYSGMYRTFRRSSGPHNATSSPPHDATSSSPHDADTRQPCVAIPCVAIPIPCVAPRRNARSHVIVPDEMHDRTSSCPGLRNARCHHHPHTMPRHHFHTMPRHHPHTMQTRGNPVSTSRVSPSPSNSPPVGADADGVTPSDTI